MSGLPSISVANTESGLAIIIRDKSVFDHFPSDQSGNFYCAPPEAVDSPDMMLHIPNSNINLHKFALCDRPDSRTPYWMVRFKGIKTGFPPFGSTEARFNPANRILEIVGPVKAVRRRSVKEEVFAPGPALIDMIASAAPSFDMEALRRAQEEVNRQLKLAEGADITITPIIEDGALRFQFKM